MTARVSRSLALATVLVATLATTGTTQAALVALIDLHTAFTPPAGADANGNHWNAIGGAATYTTPVTVSNLKTTSNGATTWDLTVSGLVDKPSPQGDVGWSGGGVGLAGPAPFDQDFAYKDGIFSQDSNAKATITLADLTPNTQYNFTAIGGRTSTGANGVITVTTGTGTGGTLLNTGALLDFSVVSNASGVIAFTFNSANASSGGTSSNMSAFRMQIIPEPASLALAGVGALLVLPRRRRDA